MNKYDNSDFENQFTEENRRPRKKLFLSVTAVLVAALVAVVSVISISAGTPEAETAVLTLADAETASASDSIQTTGYMLTDVSDVVEQALPSVVSITSRSLVEYYGYGRGNGSYGRDIDDIFDYFFGDSYGGRGGSDGYYYYEGPEVPESPEGEYDEEDQEHSNEVDSGMGSGTIISQNDTELLILTSYHVVEDCSSLYVTFNNGANVDGTVKAADAAADRY